MNLRNEWLAGILLLLLGSSRAWGALRDTGDADAASRVAMLCAGMRANVDGIRSYSVEVEERAERPDGLAVHRVRIRWAYPGKFIAEDLSQIQPPGPSSGGGEPAVRRAFDGTRLYRDLDFGNDRKKKAQAYRRTGFIAQGTGLLGDMGGFIECNPYTLTWQRPRSTENGVEGKPVWEVLAEDAAAGRVKRVDPAREYGVGGWGITVSEGTGEYYVWVDEQHGYIPRIFRDAFTELRVESIRRAGGAWFPTLVVNRSARPGPRKPSITTRVTHLEVNRETGAEKFRLAFASGTMVTDQINGTQYVVGRWRSVAVPAGVVLAVAASAALLMRRRRQRRSLQRTATVVRAR
jgi:hypothetical protein